VPDVRVADGGRELDLDAHDAAVDPLHQQVDLPRAGGGAQVVHRRLGGLGGDPHAERGQRLEQRPGEVGARRSQQRVSGDAEQARRERGVGELVLRRLLQAREGVARGEPAGHRVEQPQPGEVVAVGDRRGLRGLGAVAAPLP